MKKDNKQLVCSPSDLMKFMESDFITWMDRYHLEFPDQQTPDEPDEHLIMLQEKGNKHELAYLKQLDDQGKEIIRIPSSDDSHSATNFAMNSGADIIYQAHLVSNNDKDNIDFSGYADFLFKVEGISRLGNWHYKPLDTKLALKAKPHFAIQLCCYAEMLASTQGVRPKHFHLVLGNGDTKSFRTEDYFYFYEQLKNSFLQQQRCFNADKKPELTGSEDYGHWTKHAENILKEQDHLGLIANIRKIQIKTLQKNGILTLTQLAKSPITNIPKMSSSTLETLKNQAAIQLKSAGKKIPEYEIIHPKEQTQRRGLSLLPPASTNDVWLDIEGYPYATGGLEYLFGATHLDNNSTLTFKDWWAHNHQQEKSSFQYFIHWAYTRWKADPSMHIYHYSHYELTALKRLMGQYGTCEEEMDTLLRNDVFVDLYKIISQGVRVGTQNYSLKCIELLYKDNVRATTIKKATDSIVYYEKWLETQDGQDHKASNLLRLIREYNKEDTESIKLLCDWLRDRQKESKISYLEKQNTIKNDPQETSSDKINIKASNRKLAQELLTSLETSSNRTQHQQNLTELIAHILEFHNREEKPIWWAMFDRHSMTDEQLIEDLDSLGALERTATPMQLDKKSRLYEYSYDPTQNTKIKAGDQCYYAHDLDTTVKVASINMDNGLIQITVGPSKPEPPQKLSLIPYEYVSAQTIQESIFATTKEWLDTGKLPQALEDFLLRRRPNIAGRLDGPLIRNSLSLTEETIDIIKNMISTTLCIQGPPGSGKTHIAAHAIIDLLRNGKTVGITSNGHKAIANLMDRVMAIAEEQNVSFSAAKIQSNEDVFYVTNKNVASKKTASEVFSKKHHFKLIGGTAWAFSNKSATEQLDYLFIDEAGQVSMANLFGMAASAKNIVLMGDQIQLSQPTKGVHPGKSGESCLNYLLEEHQTTPKELGIFLDTTHRLHPNICKFISETFYEGRLKPQLNTQYRQIILPQKTNNLITKESGVLFVPVVHEDNSQNSDEEVEKIKELVSELLEGKFIKDLNNAPRALTIDDILIMAPYNMQVHKLKKALPQVHVGSVDKFQGQEKPIIILSMCASNTNDAARNLEFLFSKNRLNVAISRAQVLAIVVGNPNLTNVSCNTVKQMELTNLFCKVIAEGSPQRRSPN